MTKTSHCTAQFEVYVGDAVAASIIILLSSCRIYIFIHGILVPTPSDAVRERGASETVAGGAGRVRRNQTYYHKYMYIV